MASEARAVLGGAVETRPRASARDCSFQATIGHADIRQTHHFVAWFADLRDRQAKARIDVRIRRLSLGNPGQVRFLPGGVAEMKIDYGPGYRVYYTQRGTEIVILLCGGGKRTQERDIERALAMAQEV